jgi:hypothetical protein
MQIRHDVGTGDFFNVESLWSVEKKASLEVIFHAFPDCPGSKALIFAMKSCPTYQHVEHRALAYPTERPPGVYPTLRDHAIGHLLTFHGSAFLEDRLKVQEGFYPPVEFDVVVPSTPKNGPNCGRWIRPEEWTAVIARLEERETYGLIINSPGGKSIVPKHPRLIDWTGRTTLPQAIEILKRAQGYIGVDSCLAILAAQLFKSADLWVRTNNPYIFDSPWLHYPPQTDYSFLFPKFGSAPHPSAVPRGPIPGGQVVELRCNALVGARNYTAFDRVEVTGDRAALMLSSGQAIEGGI